MGSPRPKSPSRAKATSSVLKAANIDTAGVDPAMKQTLAREAARRVGAAGVQVKTVNPIDNVISAVQSMFKARTQRKGR